MAGGGAGFLAGLLSGLGGGLLQQEDRKREEASKGKQQYLGVLTKAVEAGDLDPTVGYPLISQIIAEPLKNFTEKGSRGSKGKGGGIEGLIAQLADPENMSAFLVNAHKTIGGQAGGRPLSGTAPTQEAGTGAQPTGESETTKLNPNEEAQFQQWAKTNGITDVDHPDSHYDYRGYWQQTQGAPHEAGQHFPDTYKQHGHPTFSTESKYSRGANDGGTWVGDQFMPGLLSSRSLPSTKPQGAFRGRAEREAQELEFGRKKTEQAAEAGITGKARGELLAIQSYMKANPGTKADDAAFVLFGRQRKGPSGVKVVPGFMTAAQIAKADSDPKDLNGDSFTPEEGASYQRVQVPNDEGGTDFRYIAGPAPKQTGSDNILLKNLPTALKERVIDRWFKAGGTLETLNKADQPTLQPFLKAAGEAGVSAENVKSANASEMAAIRSLNLRLAREGEVTPANVSSNAQSVNVGGKPRRYINLGNYSEKEKDAARNEALKAGVTPLLPAQAQKVEDGAGAAEDARAMLDQIRSKLPATARDRPWAALRNVTFRSIQADQDLAAYKAWSVTAMPIVRAIGAMGRITNVELGQARNALPTETDTVGVAGEKVEILTGILERGMNRLLARGDTGESSSKSTKIIVKDPKGKSHPFDTQDQADEFKRLARIK